MLALIRVKRTIGGKKVSTPDLNTFKRGDASLISGLSSYVLDFPPSLIPRSLLFSLCCCLALGCWTNDSIFAPSSISEMVRFVSNKDIPNLQIVVTYSQSLSLM